MRRFWIIGMALFALSLSGCASTRGQLNCDLTISAAQYSYGVETGKDAYELRCFAQHDQYREATGATSD